MKFVIFMIKLLGTVKLNNYDDNLNLIILFIKEAFEINLSKK